MPVSAPIPSGASRFFALPVGSRLVDYQPIEPELLDYGAKFLEIYGLLQIAIDSKLVAIHQVTFLTGRSEYDHRNAFSGHSTLHLSEDLDAIHFGQLKVEQNQSGCLFRQSPAVFASAKEKIKRLLAI